MSLKPEFPIIKFGPFDRVSDTSASVYHKGCNDFTPFGFVQSDIEGCEGRIRLTASSLPLFSEGDAIIELFC